MMWGLVQPFEPSAKHVLLGSTEVVIFCGTFFYLFLHIWLVFNYCNCAAVPDLMWPYARGTIQGWLTLSSQL